MTLKKTSVPRLTEEGYRVYEIAVRHLRTQLARGNTYEQACGSLTGIEREMKQFIVEDFLKILIAEDHFGGGMEIDEMALYLGMPYEELEDAMMALIGEIVREIRFTPNCVHAGSTLTH